MSIIDAAVLLIGCLFGFYGLATAVEYGVVFKILGQEEPSKKLFTPVWEITNVFLVFGFTALAFLFNNALGLLSHSLLATLVIGIILMLARACAALTIFYIKDSVAVPLWLLWLFAGCTFLVPLAFTSAGIFLLTGELFWRSLLGFSLMLAALVGFCAVGLLWVSRNGQPRQQLPGQLSFGFWLLILGSALPLISLHTHNYLDQNTLVALDAAAGAGLGLMLLGFVRKKTVVAVWPYGLLLSVVVPIILAWANRPYLIAGKLTLARAYGAQAYGSVVVIGLAVMLPLILAGFWMFARLYSTDKS